MEVQGFFGRFTVFALQAAGRANVSLKWGRDWRQLLVYIFTVFCQDKN